MSPRPRRLALGLVAAGTLALLAVLAVLSSPSPAPESLVQHDGGGDSAHHYWGANLFARFSGKTAWAPTSSSPQAPAVTAVTTKKLRVANPITEMHLAGGAAAAAAAAADAKPPAAKVGATPTRTRLLRKLKALLKGKPAGSARAAAAAHRTHRAMITATVPDSDSQKLAQVTVHTGGCGGGATVIPCDQMKGIKSDWATLQNVDSMDKNLINSLESATVVSPTYGAYSSVATPIAAPCAGVACGTTVTHTHIPAPVNSAIPSVLNNLQGLIDNMQLRMLLTPWGSGGTGGAPGPPGEPGAPGTPGSSGKAGTSITGPPGRPGVMGPTGQRGMPGMFGDTGKRGKRGEMGMSGPAGAAGPPGLTGSAGFPGPEGPRGSLGPAGAEGKTGFGLPGPPGPAGATGGRGRRGKVGDSGPLGPPGEGKLGPAGPRGDVGAAGPPGGLGQQGPMGPPGIGMPGPPGTSGLTGSTGGPGPRGYRGRRGLRGRKGWKGASGKRGLRGRGFPGKPGPPGPPGNEGLVGLPGMPGRGYPGQRGPSGRAGNNGLPGEPGEEGTEGKDGEEGAPGLPGKRGDTGKTGRNGKAGRAGYKGADGLPGTPGAPSLMSENVPDKHIYIHRHIYIKGNPPADVAVPKSSPALPKVKVTHVHYNHHVDVDGSAPVPRLPPTQHGSKRSHKTHYHYHHHVDVDGPAPVPRLPPIQHGSKTSHKTHYHYHYHYPKDDDLDGKSGIIKSARHVQRQPVLKRMDGESDDDETHYHYHYHHAKQHAEVKVHTPTDDDETHYHYHYHTGKDVSGHDSQPDEPDDGMKDGVWPGDGVQEKPDPNGKGRIIYHYHTHYHYLPASEPVPEARQARAHARTRAHAPKPSHPPRVIASQDTCSPKPADEYARHVKEAAAVIESSYPDWARSTGGSLEPWAQQGEWSYKRGPPYVKKLTMFKGTGVDQVGVGTLIRRVLGLNTAAGRKCDLTSCDHAMTGNSYINTFDGSQFRFLYRNWCSTIVIPPLRAAGPVLDARGLYRLHHWLTDGKNTLVVGGGDANIAFINGNCIGPDGGFSLEAERVDGPFEAQAAVINSPFESLPVSLEGHNQAVVGVSKSSLPSNAISYYEMNSASVMFEIPTGTGRIVYLAYEFQEPATGWVQALLAATMYPDFVKH